MATERRPWPTWAADGYYQLHAKIHRADCLAKKAMETQHHNIYLTAKILSHLVILGGEITGLSRELQLHKYEGEQWPKWASESLKTIRRSGQYISAWAKHGFDGLNIEENNQDNWNQVLKGIFTCVEYTQKAKIAILAGPAPEVEFLPENLARTLEMGHVATTGRWRRIKK